MRITTDNIKDQLIKKYENGEFRIIGNDIKTVEIQNAHFIADKDYIIRKPNYDYAAREIEWYKTQSLYVEDIPGATPVIWKHCADTEGKINSNYGWCIWSNENGNQYKSCLRTLIKDSHSRQACMIYTRPTMQKDAFENGKHDFMCTYCVQCFLNDVEDGYELKYIVYQRSCDCVFGYCNDILWHKYVYKKLAQDLTEKLNKSIIHSYIEYNCGSLHVYERHFKYLTK